MDVTPLGKDTTRRVRLIFHPNFIIPLIPPQSPKAVCAVPGIDTPSNLDSGTMQYCTVRSTYEGYHTLYSATGCNGNSKMVVIRCYVWRVTCTWWSQQLLPLAIISALLVVTHLHLLVLYGYHHHHTNIAHCTRTVRSSHTWSDRRKRAQLSSIRRGVAFFYPPLPVVQCTDCTNLPHLIFTLSKATLPKRAIICFSVSGDVSKEGRVSMSGINHPIDT